MRTCSICFKKFRLKTKSRDAYAASFGPNYMITERGIVSHMCMKCVHWWSWAACDLERSVFMPGGMSVIRPNGVSNYILLYTSHWPELLDEIGLEQSINRAAIAVVDLFYEIYSEPK